VRLLGWCISLAVFSLLARQRCARGKPWRRPAAGECGREQRDDRYADADHWRRSTRTSQNAGSSAFSGSATVLVFEDENVNGAFDSDVDTVLGSQRFEGPIASGATMSLTVPVSAVVRFRDDLVYAFVDSAQEVAEVMISNNLANSGTTSTYQPPIRTWQPKMKWQWDSTSAGVQHGPAVAPLIDTNGERADQRAGRAGGHCRRAGRQSLDRRDGGCVGTRVR